MTPTAHLLWATPPERRAPFQAAVAALGVPVTFLETAEALLYSTRSHAPLALIVDDSIVKSVSRLDLIALLRRRKHLSQTPLICLGPAEVARHAAVIGSGGSLYLAYDTPPQLVTMYLSGMVGRERADAALRGALARLQQFERAYREAERVKDDLTHMLVHDLKSPVASVMGLLGHALDITSDSTSAHLPDHGLRELLSLAYGEAQHLLNLAANILDVRRMKEGNMPYQPAWIGSVSDLVRTALGDVSVPLKERRVSVFVRPEAERVYADGALLRRVLANLFANAVKHTRQGGHIDFRARKDEEGYLLFVRDDGEGIPEADQGRIFNAFEQSRHTLHDRFDTGMGLTFCKLAVEKHGGKIWVESKVGRGSTFFFTVPLNVAAPLEQGDVLLT